ncbi:coiled-coil domain-containing protein 137-like [Saccostrea echinata]|uniref:coiled-coil domain-containing protein 137-like n=1 Tax=Saccostrea echinata TaxID=191078 RepID=UPI002A8292EB|nr:coiled-coil domain-containing protein 137-like [Saccostrea echinata]
MGKIGKLQKSRKHKKLKNVGSEYASEYRGKPSNLAPTSIEQDVPKKVKNIIKFQGKTPRQIQKEYIQNNSKKGKKPIYMERGMTRPMAEAPKFVQGKREKTKDFMKRVEVETRKVLHRHQLSQKFKMDMDALEAGEIKRHKKKITEKQKERLQQKKQRRSEKKRKNLNEFDDFEDRVKFGEVANEPPSLTALPRKAVKEESVPRPGKKSLLLKEIIADNAAVTPSSVGSSSKREIGQSIKRKHMSLAQQSIMDRERENAIMLYRQQRQKKLKTF